MAIRKANDSGRVTVRLTGTETLHDVAMRLFHDERIIPLLRSLNPSVTKDPPPNKTNLTVPSKGEAQVYAKKNGFTLGYNPAKGGSTKAKRNWQRLKDGAQKKNGDIDPHQLVSLFETQKLAKEMAARRMVALIPDASLIPFLEADDKPAYAQEVAEEIETLRLRSMVRAAVKAFGVVLEKTQSPRGRRRLAEAAHADPEKTSALLTQLLVVDKLRDDLVAKLSPVAPLIEQARALSTIDAVTREVSLRGNPDAEKLGAVAQAMSDGGEPLSDARLETLDIHRQLAAFEKHVGQIATTFKRILPTIERAPRPVVHAVTEGDQAADIPRPWPVVVKLLSAFGDQLDAVHPGRHDEGIACLLLASSDGASPGDITAEGAAVGAPSSNAGPVLSAAELASRAAHNAKVADDHDAVPARLAPTVCALFDLYRPSAKDSGPEGQVRQRRKARFETAILAPKGKELDAEVITDVVAELLSLAPDLDDRRLARAAKRFGPAGRKAAGSIAKELDSPLHLLLRSASDVGCALVLAAVALDAEIAPTLARPSGIEAAIRLVNNHAVRVLTLSAQEYLSGGQRN